MYKPAASTTRSRPTAPADASLIQQALALRRAALDGHVLPQLRGTYFALVCEDPQSAEAVLFESAACGLGGRVARIRPKVAHIDRRPDVHDTATWLGRIYDAVECQRLPAARVQEIRDSAGIPVFDCLSCEVLDGALDALRRDGATEMDARRYVLQARLLCLFG
jgi:ornithine carbamoyltransferase